MDLPPKNPWKKGSLVPLSSSKGMIKNNNIDDGKNSINSNNVLGGLEIAGNKIKQSSGNNNNSNNGKLLSQQQSKQKDETHDMQDEEEEEKKEGFIFQKRMSSSRASSNMYVDKNYDQEIDLDDALTEYEDIPMPLESGFPVKGDFTALMRNQVENNPELKRIYDNHFLDAKRREHDEEQKKLRFQRKKFEEIEELKRQTSKPFNTKQFSTLTGNRLRLSSTSSTTNNSHKQRSIAGTLQGLSSTAYERSTEYTISRQEVQSERGIGENDEDMDLDLDDEDVAHSEYLGFRNYQGSSVEIRRQSKGVEEKKKKKIEKQTNLKPFKISELCKTKRKNGQEEEEEEGRKGQEQQLAVNSNNGITQVASQATGSSSLSFRKHLSMKEKRRVAAEEALLQKMEQKKLNSKTGWVVKEQPSKQTIKKQVNLVELAEQKEKAQQIQRIEQSVKEIDRNMSAVNRQRVAAMVAGNNDMQSMNENKPMTELDLELSAREAEQYVQERIARMNQLHELMEDSVDDLSQMSAADFRQRALFITDFNKKTKENSLANSEIQGGGGQKKQKGQGNSQANAEDEEEDDFDSQSQGSQGIIKKNGAGGYFIQKNIDAAWKNELTQAEEGQVSRLPQEARDRLDELLQGVDDFQVSTEEQRLLRERNPFGVDEDIQNQLQMIDQQLQAVQMNHSQITQLLGHDLFSLKDALLPSDPQLRHQAEQKILQAKLQEVNQRLQTLFDNANNNGKIGNKVQKIKIQDLLASIVEERQQGKEEKNREGQEEQKDNRNGRVQNTGIVQNYLPLLSDGGVLELQNIQSEFEANEKLLEDSRRLMANMQSVEIDKEIGEYRVLLMEGEEEQKRIEEENELERDQELMEEQTLIMSDLRSRLNDIEGIQEEIRLRERKFIEEIRENHLDAALGITFTKGQEEKGDGMEEKKKDTGEVGQVEDKGEYEDYEVEDLRALQEQEAQELQERIEKELKLIEQKYKDLSANEIDSHLAELEEQDTALTNHLLDRDPKVLEGLRESIVQTMEKEYQEQDIQKQLRESQMKSWRMGLQAKEGEKDEDEDEEDLEESGVFEEDNEERQDGEKEDGDKELVEKGNLEMKEEEEEEENDNNNEGEVIREQEHSKDIEDVDLAERKKKFEEYLAKKQLIKQNEDKLQKILQQQQEKDRQQEKETNSPAFELIDSLLQPDVQNRISSNSYQNNRDNNQNMLNTQNNNNIQLIDSLMVQPEQQYQKSPPKSQENHQFEDSLEM